MYLSRLFLNSRDRAARRDLADCQALHRTIMSALPDRPGEPAARARLGVLFRLELHPRTGVPVLLVQSSEPPDWSRLGQGYLVRDPELPPNPQTRPLGEAYDALRAGQILTFRLRANPTRKIDTRSGPDGRRRNGQRVELRTEEQQLAWLQRRAEQGGFELLRARRATDRPDVRVLDEVKLLGRRPTSAGQPSVRLTFGSTLFEGQLRIIDADRFRQTLEQGLGSGKAYGFGLLSISRVRS